LQLDEKGWGIQSMTFLNNDAWIAVGRLDTTINVFDAKSGAVLFQSDRIDDLGQVTALERSHDSKHLIAGGSKGQSLVFEVDSQGQLSNPKPLYRQSRDTGTVVASPRFDFVITGGHDGTLAWQPYDHRSDNLKLLQKLKKQVQAAYLPMDGTQAMATDGQQLVRFNLQSGELGTETQLNTNYSHAAAFHPQGTHLAVSYGSEVHEFITDSGVRQRTYQPKKSGIQWSVAFHPNKPWLFTGDRGKVLVWDRNSGEQLAELDLKTTQYVQTLALSADARYIAAVPASAGQSVKIFKIVE
jgi:WD40 repeat protein